MKIIYITKIYRNNKVIDNNFLLMKLVSSPPNFSGHQSAKVSRIVKGKLMAVITIT